MPYLNCLQLPYLNWIVHCCWLPQNGQLASRLIVLNAPIAQLDLLRFDNKRPTRNFGSLVLLAAFTGLPRMRNVRRSAQTQVICGFRRTESDLSNQETPEAKRFARGYQATLAGCPR
jgi:hypothetical protein